MDFLATYQSLPDEARIALSGTGNAYLSYYARIKVGMVSSGEEPPSREEFLSYFGFTVRAKLSAVENKISSMLDKFGI